MSTYENLGENSLDISSALKDNQWFYISNITDDPDFKNCPIKTIDARTNRSKYYYTVGVGINKQIAFDNGSTCIAYPIKKGYLKNCFAIVNTKNDRSKVYIASENRVLNFLNLNFELTPEFLDALIDDELLVYQVAEELSTISVDGLKNNNAQCYEAFCSDLPKDCLKNYEFRKRVMRQLNHEKIKISDAKDSKVFNEKYCKKVAQQYFERLTQRNGCPSKMNYYKQKALDLFNRLMNRSNQEIAEK